MRQLLIFLDTFEHFGQDWDGNHACGEADEAKPQEYKHWLLLKFEERVGAADHLHRECDHDEADEDDAALSHSLGEQVDEGAGRRVKDRRDRIGAPNDDG